MKYLVTSIFWCCSFSVYSQSIDSLKEPIVSGARQRADSVTSISVLNYFQLLKDDFIQQAVSPFHMTNTNLLPATGFALLTAGVMSIDEPINHRAVSLHEKSSFVRAVSPVVTSFGGRNELYVIGALGAWSYIFKDQKMKNTTLLATQSYLTSGVWVSVIKFITGRARPSYYDPTTHENEPDWHGMFFQFRKDASGKKPDGSQYSSFPSGHSAAAFSVATVFATEYRDKPWVPVVAYTSSTLIALSRITENKHWASDVLVGSALGYVCGKQVVRNFHRMEKLNALHKKKNTMAFNVNYMNRTIMPEMIYTFR